MSKITKKNIITVIKKKYSTSNKIANETVEAFFLTIIKLSHQNQAILKNFGKFHFYQHNTQKSIYNFHTKQSETKNITISKIHFTKSHNL